MLKIFGAHWFGHYGIPKYLQSDQANNVDGSTIRLLCESLAIKKLRSSAYHPSGNGSAERAIQALKTCLRSMCLSRNMYIHHWDRILPEAVLHCNNSTNSSIKFSPFQVAHGISANTVIDNKFDVDGSGTAQDRNALRQNVVANRADARISYQSQANKPVKVIEHKIGDQVLPKRTNGAYPKINPYWVAHIKSQKILDQ